MRINDRAAKPVKFDGDGGGRLSVHYDNRGEPFRDGVTLGLEDKSGEEVSVFLECEEVVALRDYLNAITGLTTAKGRSDGG